MTEKPNHPYDFIADLICSALLRDGRQADAVRFIKHGDIANLLSWERHAIEWLAENWKSGPIVLWTAEGIKAYRTAKLRRE